MGIRHNKKIGYKRISSLVRIGSLKNLLPRAFITGPIDAQRSLTKKSSNQLTYRNADSLPFFLTIMLFADWVMRPYRS